VVIPMQEDIVGNSRTMLLLLLGAVGFGPAHRLRQRRQPALHSRSEPSKESRFARRLARDAAACFSSCSPKPLLARGRRWARRLLVAYGTLTSAARLLAGQVPRAEEISIVGECCCSRRDVDAHRHLAARCRRCVQARSDINERTQGKVGAATVRSASGRDAC